VRAAHPDHTGHVVRDGIRLGYEVFGVGDPTVLLMPTWTIIHTRFWKFQVPYLARRYRVITYDGPGNGGSDRVTDPARYSLDSYAADAKAVLDVCGVDQAVVAGLSLGAAYSVRFASLHPDRVLGLVLIGSSIPLTPPHPERAAVLEGKFDPYPPDPQGWQKYNVAYWHNHYQDFVEFFFEQCFNEPHSTKPREDAVEWGLETVPEVLEAEARKPLWQGEPAAIFDDFDCPVLVIHGTKDRISPHQVAVEAARLSDGALLSIAGGGHLPNVRDPVPVNLAMRDFIERVGQ
jgi:pimeloyl-ACP methyl ester carboxylesterase